MAIPPGHQANFETLPRAARAGDLALMECQDAVTLQPRYVLCAVEWDAGEYGFVPFGHLHDCNPYEAYLPPRPEG
ncbi:DUF6117 family protein [Sphingomonas sp. MMS12-HWE2-04]|uniref:DUF6117 family protein n=1 Tax=Sphingomonas sp. MMS12-HWE2-04 TaxID=3234199 RepID=UPI00384DA7B0